MLIESVRLTLQDSFMQLIIDFLAMIYGLIGIFPDPIMVINRYESGRISRVFVQTADRPIGLASFLL